MNHDSSIKYQSPLSKANPQVIKSRRFLFCREASYIIPSRCLSCAESNIFRCRRAETSIRYETIRASARLKDACARRDKCAVNLDYNVKIPHDLKKGPCECRSALFESGAGITRRGVEVYHYSPQLTHVREENGHNSTEEFLPQEKYAAKALLLGSVLLARRYPLRKISG